LINGVSIAITPFLGLSYIGGIKSLNSTRSRNKFACVGSIMIMSAKVQMSSLVSIMSSHQQEELNVVEGSACNCSYLMWKPTSYVMAIKVSQITSWVLMCSLPWAQCKRWIPIRSMGCVHKHWGMPTIQGWGNPSYIWSVVQKTREYDWKVRETSQNVSQTPTSRPEHDKIWA
jgi:hypothetical protein